MTRAKRRNINIDDRSYQQVVELQKAIGEQFKTVDPAARKLLEVLGIPTWAELKLSHIIQASIDFYRRVAMGELVAIPKTDIPDLEKQISDTVAMNVRAVAVSVIESMGAKVERAEIFPDRLEVEYLKDGERKTAMFNRVRIAGKLTESEWFAAQRIDEKVAD